MHDLLRQLLTGQPLTAEQSAQAFERIMTGQADPAQVGALLALIQARGPVAAEIVGAARVMRQHSVRVQAPPGLTLIDTCGTGGDGSHTFNISTAAALVVAAVSRPRHVAVAKHGNRSITSKSGSSQVLETLGVRLAVTPATLTRCLDEAGICFCFAPAHHPAMKHAAPIRQALGFRTIFNVLGPLTNPAGAGRQLIGVFDPNLTQTLASVLAVLGSQQAMVVHGQLGAGLGIDEISTCGPTRISHLRAGQVRTFELDAASLGLPRAAADDLRTDSPQHSAEIIRAVLQGQKGAPRDIVCLNAAAALLVADLAGDLKQGLQLAGDAIDRGHARRALAQLVELTNAGKT